MTALVRSAARLERAAVVHGRLLGRRLTLATRVLPRRYRRLSTTGWSLEKTAESFHELCTRMTGLQRRLIEAVRSGEESDPRTRELAEEARTVIAACKAAARAMTLGYDAREVEARALRARVLHPPLDGVLVMAAARSLARPYGYVLLADAQTVHAAEVTTASDVWAERSVLDLLSAPQGMGEFRAGHVADHLGLAADALDAELDDSARERLIAGLRECAGRAARER